jgi:hypothetical protein
MNRRQRCQAFCPIVVTHQMSIGSSKQLCVLVMVASSFCKVTWAAVIIIHVAEVFPTATLVLPSCAAFQMSDF